MIELTLPFPPSVNHYWRHVGSRTLISRAGREYREAVCNLLARRRMTPLEGRLGLLIEAAPPDRRRRDLDNMLKAVLDSAQHGGVYGDDGQIDWLCVSRRPVVTDGRADLYLQSLDELGNEFQQRVLSNLVSHSSQPRSSSA